MRAERMSDHAKGGGSMPGSDPKRALGMPSACAPHHQCTAPPERSKRDLSSKFLTGLTSFDRGYARCPRSEEFSSRSGCHEPSHPGIDRCCRGRKNHRSSRTASFDHTAQSALPVTRHLSAADRRERDASVVLYDDAQDRVSLHVRDDLFVGCDHLSGAYFAGAMYESEVMLFDSLERRYYRFHVQQVMALASVSNRAYSTVQRTELQET
jgi:hypothetical protein